MEQYKTCPDCKQLKLLIEFHNNKKSKDGKATYCKPCLLARGKTYKDANPEKVKATNKKSKAKNYQKSKITTQKWREANRSRYLEIKRDSHHRHSETNKARSRKQYQANPKPYKTRANQWAKNNPEKAAEIFRLASKKWREANPEYAIKSKAKRRARLSQVTSYEITQKEMKRLRMQPCIYCGQPAEHLDHVIPLSRGGNHSIGNLVPACASCNLSKYDKTIMEWQVWKLKR